MPRTASVEYDLSMIPLLLAALLAVPDGIEVAGASAGTVRTPSAETAWGGVRENGPERVADYNLEAVLDPEKHTLEGKARVVWTNRSDVPVSRIYVHLYLNAFEGAGSTFHTEYERYGGLRSYLPRKKREWGWIDLRKVEQDGEPVTWSFVHPDGGPETDRTVARLELAESVAPGETAVLDFEFHDQLPRVVARTGWFGAYHLVAQWFPKIGVLELPGERGNTEPRWNCHEFHLHSEFYADFGSYRAEITVPKGYTLGSVGTEIGPPQETPQGMRYRIAQDDVHDFAFVAWNGFARPLEGDFQSTHVKVLAPPEYADSAEDALRWTLKSLEYFSRTLGPYPYPQVTVVVPPYNALESGGMEYETFFTTVGALGAPLRPFVPFVTVHEFGHGYFMGLLASNEFEEPWLDEGLNEFWDARLVEPTPIRWKMGPAFNFWDLERSGTRRFQPDAIAGNSWDRFSNEAYGLIYSRTALVLHDLEARLPPGVLARGMAEYYRRWRFRHPSTADLEQALAETAGGQAPLVHRVFAEQIYQGAPVDDRVVAVEAKEIAPEPGTVFRDGSRIVVSEQEAAQARKSAAKLPWRSVVEVRRYAAHVPQTLVLRFDDGKTETVQWPEGENWHRFVFERPARIASAQLDPQRKVLLDLDKLDDGRTRELNPLVSRRWTLEYKAWVELGLAMLEAL